MGSKSGQPAARLGDIDTGHPPSPPTPVITASSNVIINGRGAARKGDMLAPHHPGVRIITEGSSSVLINGRPAARVTDAINCGGKMIVGSGDVIIGDNPTPKKPKKVNLPKIVFPNQSGRTPSITQADGSVIPPQKTNKPVFYTPPTTNHHELNAPVIQTKANTTALQQGKSHAVDYWQNIERNADNFPAALGAHLMKLNAEAGYSIAEGAKATYETLTDWEKFKAAADGIKDSVVNYEETFQSFKESAQQFADLPANQQGDAAYKMLMGTLAGGAAAKGVGAVSKMGKTQLTKSLPKPSTQDISLAKSAGATAAHIAARKKVALSFYEGQGMPKSKIQGHLSGIDFSKSVEAVELPKGKFVNQYQIPGGSQGSYYAPLGTAPSKLGISKKAKDWNTGKLVEKKANIYETNSTVKVLKSTAAEIDDTWSIPGKTVHTDGGGTQFFTMKKDSFNIK